MRLATTKRIQCLSMSLTRNDYVMLAIVGRASECDFVDKNKFISKNSSPSHLCGQLLLGTFLS